MRGFTASLTDFTGNPVSQDYFGNPLCTVYKTDANGKTMVDAKGNPTVVRPGGQCTSTPAPAGTLANPVGTTDTSFVINLRPGTTLANLPVLPFVITMPAPPQPPGTPSPAPEQIQVTKVTPDPTVPANASTTPSTWTVVRGFNTTPAQQYAAGTNVPDPSNQPESDGTITIPNMAPGRYGVNVIAPDKGWIQTTTLEGSHDFDLWLTGNDSGLDTEMVAAGEPVPFVQFGFARAALVNITNPPPNATLGTNTYNAATGSNPNTGAFASAGCRVLPTFLEGTAPSGDIQAQFRDAMQPCGGTNLKPRIDPGVDGQKPTQDGSLQADSWRYPFDPKVYGAAPTGEVTGHIVSMEPYVPGVGGLPGRGGANGQAGIRPDNKPIVDAWVALADLNNGDQTAIVAPAKSDGTFDITNIPDGTYNLSFWDWNQSYAFDQYNLTIAGGQVVNEGAVPLLGWFTRITGHVFVDKNGNGKRDAGEAGVPDFLMQILNRTNNAEEGGQNVATTNDAGFYSFTQAYPLGNSLVLQFFNTKYKTTGVTCQADNDPQQHTVLTPAVDLTTLNIIGLNGYCDVGVQPYNTDPTANDNGGIVATAMYHSFRTEYNQEQSFTNLFDTGQPGVRFELWQPRPDPTGKGTYVTCTNPLPSPLPGTSANPCPNGADGSMARDPVPFDPNNGSQLSVYDSEHYGRPGGNPYSQPGCVPRGADGQVFDYSFQWSIKPGGDCIEAPLQGTSFGFATDGNPVNTNLFTNPAPNDPGAFTPVTGTSPNPSQYNNGADPYPGLNAYCAARARMDAAAQPPVAPDPLYGFPTGAQCGLHGIQVVDGNYTLTPPKPGDYAVHAVIPNDMFGKPLYKWATEATNNTYDGPGWAPNNVSPTTPMSWPVIPIGNSQANLGKGLGMSNTESTSSPAVAAKCVGAQKYINTTNPNGANYVSNPSWVDYWNSLPVNDSTHPVKTPPPWEGQKRPLCDTRLIHVQNGQSVAPNFWIYTDVPLATTFQGYAVDDISVSADRLSTSIGEVAGISNIPIGIYDWTNRQIAKVNSDYNGQYEVMLPSTNTFNCNTVAGPCAGVYRFIGNDPGQPNAPNLNWNPTYRTISATFQAWPAVYSPSDVAPTKAVVSFEGNGNQFGVTAVCSPRASEPQVFAISHPFWKSGRTDTNTLTINGLGFGTPNSNASVTLRDPDNGNTLATLNTANWTDTQITISGLDTQLANVAARPYQLVIVNAAGLQSTNTTTFHVLGTGYNPNLYEVGPYISGILVDDGAGHMVPPAGSAINDSGTDAIGKTAFSPTNPSYLPPNSFPGDGKVKGAVQRSLEVAAATWLADKTKTVQSLVVVYPNFQLDPATGNYGGTAWAPLSAYFENIVIHSPVMLQGSGPGGYYKDSNGATIAVPGTTLNGQFINANTNIPASTKDNIPGNEPWLFDWESLTGNNGNLNITNPALGINQPYAGNLNEGEGTVVYVVGNNVGGANNGPWYTTAANGFRPTMDGFTIMGGDQKGFPGNISEVGGAKTGGPPDETFQQSVQGGAIFFNNWVQHFQASNNLVQWNSGTYGAIRSGSPQLEPEDSPVAHNDDMHLHNNRIVANGGTNLAGAIGLFRGTNGYRIDNNVICGNLSAEYGGGISHFGYSPGGQIDHNKIMLNQAIDEGGGIIIAGEPPINFNTSMPDPSLTSMGAGPVSIHDNYIGDNLGYDDGGGIRFLQAGAAPMDLTNNMITDNVSAHEGGGVAIDDAANVRLVNDTITNNITTATAVTSTGQPQPAGVSTARNSVQLTNFLSETKRIGSGMAPVTIPQDQPDGSVVNVACYTTDFNGQHFVGMSSTTTAANCDALANIPFSKPLIFNDVLWGNLAGAWNSLHTTVTGICLPQNGLTANTSPCQVVGGSQVPSANAPPWDPAPNHWDIGVSDGSDTAIRLQPINSLLNSTQGYGSPGNSVVNADPNHVLPYLPAIQSDPYRLQPRFRPSSLITVTLPPNVLGDYHLSAGSGAIGIGGTSANAPSGETVKRPGTDIDGDFRPAAGPDAGADQLTAVGTAQPVAFWSGGGGGKMLSTGLVDVKGPGPTLPKGATGGKVNPAAPTVPTASAGRPGNAGSQGNPIAPVAPPARSLANVVAVGGPNKAGNTAVIQLFGARPKINGVQQVQPTTHQPAAMPGGVKGGGHFRVGGHSGGQSLSWLVFLLISMAVLSLGWWNGRRRRREPPPDVPIGPPSPSDPPVTEAVEPERQLVFAGKGDWS
jgi:hypothetical protein